MVAEALSDKSAKETKSAVIDITENLAATASDTTAIVPSVPGKKIVVTNINHMQVKLASPYGTDMIGTVFKSGSDALTGEMVFSNVPADEGQEMTVNTSYMPDGHFKTDSGEALNLTVTDKRSSGGAAPTWVYGYINYYEE